MIMTATVVAWFCLLAFLIYARIRQYCTFDGSNAYETLPDFQILAGLYIWLPLLFPLLVLALWGQHKLLRKYGR